MRPLIAAVCVVTLLVGGPTACTRPERKKADVPRLEDEAEGFTLHFPDGGRTTFDYYVVDAGWHVEAKTRLRGLLHELRASPEFRAHLDERERSILDRLQIEVLNTDRVVWSSTIRGGVETIQVSYGAVWFIEILASNMWNLLFFGDYRFVSLFLKSERAFDRRIARRWFAAGPYIRSRGYEVPPVPPQGFQEIWTGVQGEMALAGFLHELCHLFRGTAGPDAKAGLEGKSRDERLAIRKKWELEADRCAGDLHASSGGLAQMGLAMVLGVAAVADDPAQSVHPPATERIALLQDLSDRTFASLMQQGRIQPSSVEAFRELMRSYAAILEHVGSDD